MASACVNNVTLPPSLSPRMSFNGSDPANSEPDYTDFIDFEFHQNSPVGMLTADELFSDGKLVTPAPVKITPDSDPLPNSETQTRLKTARELDLIGLGTDSFAVSPKAPTCSIRWRELLRLKRQQQQNVQKDVSGGNSGTSSRNPNPKYLKHFLNRRSSDLSQTLPLLKESEPEPESRLSSSRLSLSSTSSSGREPDDLPRLSIDSENIPNTSPIILNRNPPKIRGSRPRSVNINSSEARSRSGRSPVRMPTADAAAPPRCASVDSPRMNASGKVVFQGLGRSSSSPCTFNGGPRIGRSRGMERSYSANVRVTPVLNMPICNLRNGSVFGLGSIFSGSRNGNGGGGSSNRGKN